jgi:hypothetical protein
VVFFKSEIFKHDTIAVYDFKTKLVLLLKETFGVAKKTIYFSDGAAAQYKNKKNFVNLRKHYEDFGMEAEWHFLASCHGKGLCDGLGGTVKRLAS